MAVQFTTPKFQALNDDGTPLVGGKLYTYVAGSVSTDQATYTDYTGNTENANPVILDSRGEADVWFNPTLSYKLVLKDSADVEIWSQDYMSAAYPLKSNNLSDLANVATARSNLGLPTASTTVAISGGVVTINCALGDFFYVTVNSNITSFTVNNIPSSGTAYGFILEMTANGTGYTQTWTFNSTAVSWPSGTAPTLTTTNGKRDVIAFWTRNGGTTWSGSIVGQNY